MQKYLSIIILIALILLTALGGYFFWWPKYQEFSFKKQELESKDQAIKQREEYLVGLENLSKKLSENQEEVSKIETALPSQPSVAALFNFLQKASSENGLIMEDTNIGQLYNLEKTGQGIQNMPFEISFSGSYSSFKNFLSSIYQNSRLIEVSSIKFSSPEKTEKEKGNLFTFDLELQPHAYYSSQ